MLSFGNPPSQEKMASGEKVMFVCVLIGVEGSPLELELDSKETWGDVKYAIKAKKPDTITFPASKLQLFPTLKGENLLPIDDDVALHTVINREDEEARDASPMEEWLGSKGMTGDDSKPRQIHVLVTIPEQVSSTQELQSSAPEIRGLVTSLFVFNRRNSKRVRTMTRTRAILHKSRGISGWPTFLRCSIRWANTRRSWKDTRML